MKDLMLLIREWLAGKLLVWSMTIAPEQMSLAIAHGLLITLPNCKIGLYLKAFYKVTK